MTDAADTAASGTEELPIMVDDDHENPESSIGQQVEAIVEQVRKGDARLDPIEVDDDDDATAESGWQQDEEEYERAIQQIESDRLAQPDACKELEEEGERPFLDNGVSNVDLRCEHYKRGIRNPCLCGHHLDMDYWYKDGFRLEKGHVVGLAIEVRVGPYIVDFIEIKSILVHCIVGDGVVRGVAYTRTRNLDGRLEPYKNEVCQVMEIDSNDDRPYDEQGLIEVTLDEINLSPRVLHKTNKPFPECRFDPAGFQTKEDREERAPLTCRWAHTMFYPDARYRRAQRPVDGEELRHFTEADVVKDRHRASDAERLDRWRGHRKIRGGSYIPIKSEEFLPTAPAEGVPFTPLPGQRYNAADMFSGAGGFTCGTKMAGIRVERAVDHWPRCNVTYQVNHDEVDLYETDIMEHCNDLTITNGPVDFVHLSPPCQTWSPAHTCAGKNDGANIAALSACQHIVEMLRSRILTFEQTFGIIQHRHRPYFNALLQSITRYGYSLRWKVIPLVDFGLPQNRKRLIMIGAAPGEQLPSWPAPTHGSDAAAGQKRPVSAIKACRGLIDGVDLHNASTARPCDRIPWDGNKPMNRTITTSGGQAYHWDGSRELTLAEFGRLQGFPPEYCFVGPCIKKQIGNAFPPVVVKALMKHLRKWLEQVDGVEQLPNPEEVISISDDDGEGDDKDDNDSNVTLFDASSLENDAINAAHGTSGIPEYNMQDINSGLNEEEALMAAMYESNRLSQLGPQAQHAPSQTGGYAATLQLEAAIAEAVRLFGGQTATNTVSPEALTIYSDPSSSRHPSSATSSVQYQGERRLHSIVEEGGSSSREPTGKLGSCWVEEDIYGPPSPVAPPSSPKFGDCGSASGDSADARQLDLQAAFSGTNDDEVVAGPSSQPEYDLYAAAQEFFNRSKFQGDMDDEAAFAAAMEASVQDAVKRAGYGNGFGTTRPFSSVGGSSSLARIEEEFEEEEPYEGKGKGKAVYKHARNDLVAADPTSGVGESSWFARAEEETEEEPCEGKGKGKAVYKRSYDGTHSEDGAASKKRRTAE